MLLTCERVVEVYHILVTLVAYFGDQTPTSLKVLKAAWRG